VSRLHDLPTHMKSWIRLLSLFSLALSLALTFTASSRAERPPFKVYTTAEGLAHDSVNKIVRDSRGFLWFCTAEGLSRFDGYKFKNYTQNEGLPHRNINDFLETRDGTYLIATSAGLSVFNPNGKAYRWNMIRSMLEQTADDPPMFQTFVARERAIKHTSNILCLAQDRQDVIWAGTRNGLFQIRKTGDGLEFQEFEVENWKDKGLAYTALLADSEGGLFVGSDAAFYRISPEGNLRKLTEYPSGIIFQDRDGKLWVNTATELQVFSFANDTLKLLKAYSQKDGLPPNAAHFSAKQTSDGRIFVGFEYGFSEFLPTAKESEPKFRIFAVEKINSMAEDGGGNLWVGTDSKGAWKLAHTGFTIFGEQDGISPSDEIMSVFSDRQGEVYAVARPNKLSQLTGGKFESVLPFGLAKRSWGWHFLDLLSQEGEWWIPTEDGLRRYPKVARFAGLAATPPKRIYTTGDGMFASTVFNQFEDSRGDIWLSVLAAGADTLLRWERKTDRMVPYTTADGLPAHNGPISFAEDSHGNMWFGYYFGGMARYRDGKFRLFTEPDGLPSSQVRDLLSDSLGRLWIATSGRGLFRLDDTNAEKPVFTILSTENGLSSNQPLCLTEDRFGRIYVGTGRGINRVDRNDSVKVFTQEDGLPSNYITRCAADKNGNLWFVTRNTLVRFVPEIEQAATPPLVFIDRILVNGVPQKISELGETETRPLELESAQRQIQIEFFALTFGAGENIRYQYMLDEQDWSTPIKQQTLNLDLSPGQHLLLVRAVRTDGVASEKPASVSFKILPPIWFRWWFLTIAAFVIASAVYAFTRYRYQRMKAVFEAQEALRRSREERLAELERIRKRIATDLHDDIGSSLTQISILSEVVRQRTDPNDSQLSAPLSMIAGTSRELVDSMSDIVWAINPQKDHLNDLTQRMRRFASDVLTSRNIAFEFYEPDEENDVPLGANIRREVFLIFKESVNNLVRHSGCSKVKINFQIAGGALRLNVWDDGKGFDISQNFDGHGLSSMRQRAEGIGGQLETISRSGEGTTITLDLPFAGSA
jgi:signal transduction histidine kinase/ligand-binding sensor domain-containing protein